MSLKPQAAAWTVTHTALMHTFMHTVRSDEWSPQGRVVKLRPLPPTILLSLAFHTHSLISFSSPRPLSHSQLFLTSSSMHPRTLRAHFASHSLTLVSPLNILPYQSSTVVLWLSRCSSFSVSSPLRGSTKQTESSKWNLNLNSEPWTFLPRESFHQEKQLYTLADAHTQAPSSVHVDTHECVYVHTQAA